jgi:hypothetical protein
MAAMLKSMDESLGRLLDKLDQLQIADRTIVIFMSDNGGNMYNEVEGTTPTNNHPLRNGKGSIYEGGVREPCIIAWPGVVRPGSKCSEVISSIDFYPAMLQMAAIEPKEGQVIDGVSLVPLLKGGVRLEREAIFCHFPHYVRATGNLPSTSVRKGDWKLIRFYGEGPERSHGYELYNLKDDIGEANNLASKMPEKVQELDALIEKFLRDTGALVPFKNPAYDPDSQPIRGWRPSGHCTLSIKEGALHVRSTGGDPFLHTSDVPGAAGPLVLKMRIRSASKGTAQVFWAVGRSQPFHRSRSVVFRPKHDGQWHEHELTLPFKGTLRRFRIDPSTAPGLVEIDWIRLCREDGTVVKSWDFDSER